LATRKDCQGHLERLGVELSLSASTHDGRFPQSLKELADAQAVQADSAGGATLPEWLRCPGQFPSADIGYEYVPGSGKDSPAEAIVAYDRKGNHPGGRNVLTADGKVTWLRESLFQQNLKNQNPGNPVQEGAKTDRKE
jgi:prepilin-type processing-associated H-X9-DG protein